MVFVREALHSFEVSKNAFFGLNSLPDFWTLENAIYCPWALDVGPNSGGPKNGQGKLADLDALTFFKRLHIPFSLKL
jgi:hypothetical protein